MPTIRECVREMRSAGLACRRALPKGRSCCHVRGHTRRHTRTWFGDGRFYQLPNGRTVNGETGEVHGATSSVSDLIAKCSLPRDPRRTPEDARRVLRAIWYVNTDREVMWEGIMKVLAHLAVGTTSARRADTTGPTTADTTCSGTRQRAGWHGCTPSASGGTLYASLERSASPLPGNWKSPGRP